MMQGLSDFSKYVFENALQTGLMIGAIVTVLVSFFVGYKQNQEQKEFQDKVTASQQITIDHLKKSLVDQRNLILGGDSYLYLQLSQIANTDEFILKYTFVGEYPLYDVKLRVHEYDLLESMGKIVPVDLKVYDVDLQTVHSIKSAEIFRKFSIIRNSGVVGKKYFVVGNARNGITEQDTIVYINSSGEIKEAVRVITVAPSYSNLYGDFPYGGTKRRVKKLSPDFFEELLINNTEGDHGWKKTDYERDR
ncbi:MAG: hypothetical protein JNM24_17425 [Bdellovibrionaceae bacterium]|nr:hypothetical protein [Pseudobdellovibrionaceae bacterium]